MPIHAAFLRYFIEVHRCGSIRLASRNLNVSSSAVNRQILNIEDELGIKLFDRSSSGIRTTAAGKLLVLHVHRTLTDADQTLEQIAELSDAQRPLVRIAGQESVIARFLPPALLELHSNFPEISTMFKAASGTQLQELLCSDGVDIALAFDPEPNVQVDIKNSIMLPVGAVLTPTHPLADRDVVTLADCAPYPIVLPDRSWPLRARLDRVIEYTGQALDIITSSNSVEFLKAMVDQDLGIGFQTVIGIEAQVEQGELVHVPLMTPEFVTQKFALCIKNDCVISPVLESVISLLINRLSDYSKWSIADE